VVLGRVSAIRAQITETLKQFETVNEVIVSIDSRVEDILQYLKILNYNL